MTDQNPTANRIEELALSFLFTAVSIALLATIGIATKSGPASSGWWTSPALAPGVALAVLSLANVLTFWNKANAIRRSPLTPDEWEKARERFIQILRPLEFLAYFALYLGALKQLGYGLATLAFILGLMLRLRLTSPRWIVAGLCTWVGLILIFRVGLGVWMPAPALFDVFPAPLRSALIRWF